MQQNQSNRDVNDDNDTASQKAYGKWSGFAAVTAAAVVAPLRRERVCVCVQDRITEQFKHLFSPWFALYAISSVLYIRFYLCNCACKLSANTKHCVFLLLLSALPSLPSFITAIGTSSLFIVVRYDKIALFVCCCAVCAPGLFSARLAISARVDTLVVLGVCFLCKVDFCF